MRAIDAALDEYNLRWEGSRRWVQQNLGYAGRLRSGFSSLSPFSQAVVIAVCICAIGYVLSPFDLFPESGTLSFPSLCAAVAPALLTLRCHPLCIYVVLGILGFVDDFLGCVCAALQGA